MSHEKIVKAFTSYKISPRIVIFSFALAILISVVTVLYLSDCDQRIRGTRAYLIAVRSWVKMFKDAENRYPNSIVELRKYVELKKRTRD